MGLVGFGVLWSFGSLPVLLVVWAVFVLVVFSVAGVLFFGDRSGGLVLGWGFSGLLLS